MLPAVQRWDWQGEGSSAPRKLETITAWLFLFLWLPVALLSVWSIRVGQGWILIVIPLGFTGFALSSLIWRWVHAIKETRIPNPDSINLRHYESDASIIRATDRVYLAPSGVFYVDGTWEPWTVFDRCTFESDSQSTEHVICKYHRHE